MRTLVFSNAAVVCGWLSFSVAGVPTTVRLSGWGISPTGETLTAGAAAAASAEAPMELGDLRVTQLGEDRVVVQRLDSAADDSILWVLTGTITFYSNGDIARCCSVSRWLAALTPPAPIAVTHRVIPVSEAPAEVQAAHAAHLAQRGAHAAAPTAAGDPSYW